MSQEELQQLAAEFSYENHLIMQYELPMAATIAPITPIEDPILFVFLGPSVETIQGRVSGEFWNPFQDGNGDWLHTIYICEEILQAIGRKVGMPEESALRSLDNVYLMDLYPWVEWDSKKKHSFTDADKKLCRNWFDSNVLLIKPKAVIIFAMNAAFGADDEDLLLLNSADSEGEGDADISASDVTGFMSVRTRNLNTSINVVCHPGALCYTNNNTDDRLTDFVRAFTSLHSFLDHSIPDNNPNSFADVIIDETFAKADRIKTSLRQYQAQQKANEEPHCMTLSEIQEHVAAISMSVCDATLRKYLVDFNAGKRGTKILYDLTKEV